MDRLVPSENVPGSAWSRDVPRGRTRRGGRRWEAPIVPVFAVVVGPVVWEEPAPVDQINADAGLALARGGSREGRLELVEDAVALQQMKDVEGGGHVYAAIEAARCPTDVANAESWISSPSNASPEPTYSLRPQAQVEAQPRRGGV
jgi:hypothetical protein